MRIQLRASNKHLNKLTFENKSYYVCPNNNCTLCNQRDKENSLHIFIVSILSELNNDHYINYFTLQLNNSSSILYNILLKLN